MVVNIQNFKGIQLKKTWKKINPCFYQYSISDKTDILKIISFGKTETNFSNTIDEQFKNHQVQHSILRPNNLM